MSQAVNRDHGYSGLFAMPGQNTVCGRVVHLTVHEDRLVVRQVLQQDGQLHDELPIKLYFTHRRSIFCWNKATSVLVIPSLIDRQSLVDEIKVIRSKTQCFGETSTGFCHQQYQPVPVRYRVKLQVSKDSMKFELVKIFRLLLSRLLPFDDCFSSGISLN